MFARLRRTVSVLAIIIAAYAVYAVVVVPFVEPSVKLASRNRPSTPPTARVSKLDQFFPAGSWELDRLTKVVETDQGTLFFADYKPLPDGKMKLTKCTVISYLEESASKTAGPGSTPAERRPIIIQAPHGATLKFDQPLNVLNLEFGRLIGGHLSEEVSIHVPASKPGDDDALELVTKNVQIDLEKIWTPHEVRFRYGPNSGSGRILTIHLASAGKSASAHSELGSSGVRSLELLHLDRMQLLLNDQGLFGRQKPVVTAAPMPPPKNDATPVEVKCRGPLRFDVSQQLITLEDQVDLMRHHPSGASDQLICQLLQIYFSGGEGMATKPSQSVHSTVNSKPAKLTPTRVVATGRPVIIRAASVGIGAQAERIEYDCILQRVWLQDRDKVLLNDRQREVEAKELRYTLGESNRMGELWAQGPGTVRGEFGKQPRRFEVTWQDQVQLRRIDNEPVLSFNAQAVVTVLDFGQLTGDTLHFYLREIPRADAQDRVDTVPDRLHLVGHVQVDTESCHGTMREAKIWFKQPDAAVSDDTSTKQAAQPADFFSPPQGKATDRQRSKFELRAEIVEAEIRMGDNPVVDLVIVRGGVELREVASTESQPLVIRGDYFQLQDGASEHPRAALLGAPGEVSARGAAAHGPKIYLYPADNILEIVGAGDLGLPAGRHTANSGGDASPTHIEWGGKMQFDGQIARFERDVTVRGTEWSRNGEKTTFVATGDAVHAELTERIDFRNANPSAPVELVEAAFDGWGFLQTEMFDPLGDRKLFEQMQVRGLTVNQLTGDISGQGPGWLRGVHRGKDLLTLDPAANTTTATSATGLSFLRVDFEREVMGNLHQQTLEFRNGTKTLYGPVRTWDDALDQDQTQTPPGAVRLTCDRLAVTQGGDGGADTVELEAVGNAHILGDAFAATGGRVSYVRLKDQLILEGDGRNDARIEFQPQPGARPSYVAAGKILYWPKTGLYQIDKWRQTELYDLGQLRGRGAPAIQPR